MRRGENIHKRKDGRWEGRFISAYGEKGAIYTSVYAHTYVDCAEKLALAKCGMYSENTPLTVDELRDFATIRWRRSPPIMRRTPLTSCFQNG